MKGVTTCCPVVEGYIRSGSIITSNFGGKDVTKKLMDVMRQHGNPFFSHKSLL